jgi:hypothetical protein
MPIIDEAGYRAIVATCTDSMSGLPSADDLRAALALMNRASSVGFLFAGAANLEGQRRVVLAALAARRKLDSVAS